MKKGVASLRLRPRVHGNIWLFTWQSYNLQPLGKLISEPQWCLQTQRHMCTRLRAQSMGVQLSMRSYEAAFSMLSMRLLTAGSAEDRFVAQKNTNMNTAQYSSLL